MDKRKKGTGDILRSLSKTTPTGVSPVFSKTARFRRETTHRLLNLFFLWGYREIILPSFEYLDSISPGIDPSLLTKLYIMQDRGSGQVLVLRPDATAQIARLTTQSFRDHQLPLRFCYSTSVFRDENHQASLQRELQQTGLELLGDTSVVSDGEVIELCLSGAKIFHLKNPILVLSHAGFQEALLRALAPDADMMKDLRRSFHSRNPERLLGLLKFRDQKQIAKTISTLSGSIYTLKEARSSLRTLPSEEGSELRLETKRFLDLLEKIDQSPHAISMRVDFALTPPGPYYTGMFFQLFAEESPTHLASGGRYDRLGSAFGHDLPAVGFAYHITHIEEAIRKQEDRQDDSPLVLACYGPGTSGMVEQFAHSLRKAGMPVMTAPNPSSFSGLPLSSSEILAEHVEISGVVLFDPEKNHWTLAGRRQYSRNAESIEKLADYILSGELR